MVRDLDGFVVELREPAQSGDDAAAKVILTAVDITRKLTLSDQLGFQFRTGQPESGKELLASVSQETGSLRRSGSMIPCTRIPFEIRDYQGFRQKRGAVSYSAQPGAGWLRFHVRDMDETVRTFLENRVYIASAAMQPIEIYGERHLLIRDPDGVFIELIERKPPTAQAGCRTAPDRLP